MRGNRNYLKYTKERVESDQLSENGNLERKD